MKTRKPLRETVLIRARVLAGPLLLPLLCGIFLASAFADVPGRPSPAGTSVPNPGAQQQELPNITFPAPYNVFEFVVTCMACHGGTIDQQAGHGGNWAGSSMASAARDPVFRANQILLNGTVKNRPGGADGAGNMCFRCHAPNAWLSGRFDPQLGGTADGTDMIQSILLSTDSEGVQCEQCHRAIGAVKMQRPDLDPLDPAWKNMLGPVGEWPHAGTFLYPAATDSPYGDSTLQYHDGMSYGAKYGGNTEINFSDLPLSGTYTGQTYGTYPWWFTGIIQPPPPGMPATNALGDVIQYNPDGSISFVFEGGVMPDPLWGAISPEHSTRISDFVKSSEFCGSCHEQNVPVLNHATPVQRTYTEWKYSAYGRGETIPGVPDTRCQGCHMPTMKHEYADNAPVSLNPDPVLSGWFPYARDRNIGGGTSFHKLAGGNRDLPQMMKVLYPEVDLEVVGAPTGHDPRIFPGMLSDRGPMWDRNQRNTEVELRDAVSAEIIQAPTYNALAGRWEVKVKVTNNSGHKLPSGYPDGRRMWVSLVVKDALGAEVYRSGYYDPNDAKLYTDATKTGLARALTPAIDGVGANAVMIYEKVLGTCTGTPPTGCVPSLSPLNDTILFDNRIPPLGYDYALAGPLGGAFWTYDSVTFLPAEDAGRYPVDANGMSRNWDEVTYSFAADPAAVLTARAELFYQSHTREFMDFLVSSVNALPPTDRGPRPEGPPNPLDPNYPLTPTFLSDQIAVTTGVDFTTMTDLNNAPLQDNWAGVAYAAWLLTGKGEPFLMGADDTAVAAPPGAPAVTVALTNDPNTGLLDPNAQLISWGAVPGADGYLVWIRYGVSELTSSWDKLAVVFAPETQLLNQALNVAKTYAYKVQAFNAKGLGPESAVATGQTPLDLPLPPVNTRVLGVTDTTVTLTWFDSADTEIGFIVERQDVPLDRNQPLPPFQEVARFTSPNAGPPPTYLPNGVGGITFTDGIALPACTTPPPVDPKLAGFPNGCYTAAWVALQPGQTYNYRIQAYNATGLSGPDLPVGATTTGRPLAPSALAATIVAVAPSSYRVDLTWTDNAGNETGFRVERSAVGATGPWTVVGPNLAPNTTAFGDTTVSPNTTYWYRVYAFNAVGDSLLPSNVVRVTIPNVPPNAPSNLVATPSPISPNPPTVSLIWTDNSTNETNFILERAADPGFPIPVTTFTLGANVTSYTDTTVAPKTTYYYRVFARNAAGQSAASNTATAVTPGEIPEAPSNLVVTKTTKDSVTMTWADNSNNEQGFYIERLNGTWARVGTVGPNVTTFTDTGLARKTAYTYRVQAFNDQGVTAYTNTATGTTK